MPNWKSTSWDVGAKTFYQIFSLLVQAGIWHLCLQILWREIAEWSVVKPKNTFHFWQTFLPRERIFPNLSTLAQNKLKVLIKSLPKLWKGYGKIHQTQLVVGELGWVGRCSQSALVDKGGREVSGQGRGGAESWTQSHFIPSTNLRIPPHPELMA